MLLELIARYYKFLWFAVIAVAFLKLIIAYSFDQSLEGLNGILYGLFKWYGEEEQELEDDSRKRTMMRTHNVVTLILYLLLFVILIVAIVTNIFSR